MQQICEYCGKTFIKVVQYQKYCCGHCRLTAAKKKRRKTKIYQRTCLYCSSVFETKHLIQKYCSPDCMRRSYKERSKGRSPQKKHREETIDKSIQEVRALYGLAPIVQEVINCLCCGKEFLSEDVSREKTCFACRKRAEDEVYIEYIGEGAKRNGSPYLMAQRNTY